MSLTEAASGVDRAFTSVPIIDLSKCDTPKGKLAAAHEIRDACIRVGFFYIRNHGIPPSYFDSILTAMQTYFALPIETKMKLHHKKESGSYEGYIPILSLNVDPANSNQGDFHEGFQCKWEEIEAKAPHEKSENDTTKDVNMWPSDDYPGFRQSCLEYYHAGAKVGTTLFSLFALALELPETFFDDKAYTPTMKALHYPSQDGHPEIDDDTPGIGAHTDFECFTILWQQPEIQALQVMNSEKRWIDALPIKDTLVVNIGDQLAVWTNDIFKSTVHRAINKSGKERYSVPLFFGTDYSVNIEPLPSCVTADRPAKYSPITAGDHVIRRVKEVYHIM